MQNGCVFERPTLVLLTSGNGGSVWPTVVASDQNDRNKTEAWGGHDLVSTAKTWPTPRAGDFGGQSKNATKERMETGGDVMLSSLVNHFCPVDKWQTPKDSTGGNISRSGDRKNELLLAGQAQTWNTPRASTAGNHSTTTGKDNALEPQAANWPTPCAAEADLEPTTVRPAIGTTRGCDLPTMAAVIWPTPCADDTTTRKKKYAQGGTPLSLRVQQTPKHGDEFSKTDLGSRRRLNPAFVCWLMGWPLMWTHPEPINFGAAEMASYLSRQRWLLLSFFDG
jgi:hypothetical protein